MKYRYVLHGSHKGDFQIAEPKRNVRIQFLEGKEKVVFDNISFHTSPLYWIALAYTYDRDQTFMHNGKDGRYNIGINLYKDECKIIIYGAQSLEESLQKLYGKGGYIYFFKNDSFFHTKGLGSLELITNKPIKPVAVQYIENPVVLFEKLNIEFEFRDLLKNSI